jgi:DNA repair protein RecO (recombination protein O)
MSATKSLAFVLRKRDYRDTSLLVDLYTREWGRIRGVVKGIRAQPMRAWAGFGSTLEPFSLNEVLFYRRRKGGDLHLVTQAELVDLFPALREDLERFASACYCVELVSELVESDESSPEIFELIRDTLKFLSGGASAKRASRIFEIKLFDRLGLMPEVKKCVYCGKEPAEAAYFDAAAGGLCCRDCDGAHRSGARRAAGSPRLPVSRGTLHFIDHARRAPVAELTSVKVSQEVGAELERVLRRFTDFHLSHKLKSLVFMEKAGL